MEDGPLRIHYFPTRQLHFAWRKILTGLLCRGAKPASQDPGEQLGVGGCGVFLAEDIIRLPSPALSRSSANTPMLFCVHGTSRLRALQLGLFLSPSLSLGSAKLS
jgi:hypothetical protein